MSNVVLALLTKTETAPAILGGAARLATLLGGAQVEAMVVRVDPLSTIMPTEEVLTKERESAIRGHEGERASALRHVYDTWAEQYVGTIQPRWIEQEGTADTLMHDWGGRADYIVIGRPDAHADNAEHSALHAALFDTDRPVLIMPSVSRGDFGKTVAIAWREDKFTLRAVLAALRCLSQADQVHVLMGHKEGEGAPKIPDALTEHGLTVTPHELPIGKDPFGAQLMAHAHQFKADLLVMGAFTHSKWHDMLFGGVTKYILGHADIPVLMRH